MFHGGTNFGFMNGANILGYNGLEFSPSYVPDVTREEFHLICPTDTTDTTDM